MESWWLGLKFRMSQVTDIAEKENQEPVIDQVITMEHELSLGHFFKVLFIVNKYSGFFFAVLVICTHEILDCGKWIFSSPYGKVLSSFVFYVTLLVKYRCHFVVSLV